MAPTRRLAAIMFTDLTGFTALSQKSEATALALLDEHRGILRKVFDRHHGREVKTLGDGFLIEFPSGLDAVRCAYDAQRAMHEFNLGQPEEHRLEVRIGIHLGDVVETDGDISGDAVNVASRVEPLAPPGGICFTRQIFDLVRNKAGLEFVALGTRTLKNVEAPVEVYRVSLPWDAAANGPPVEENRLAVLPLRNMSPDPNDEYFSEGMTEELITVLSKLPGVTVLARTSVMQYKGSTKRISDIARELRAGRLIEGSVRKSGSRVRITVQLLDGRTEGHVWAENYDRDLQDIFEIQSEVAAKVAEALRVQVGPADRRGEAQRPTSNHEAYLLYLKGRYHWNRRTVPKVRLAMEYFEKALALDPKFALAMVGLADSYQILCDQAAISTVTGQPHILDLAEQALVLDPTLAEAHATIGSALTFGLRDWDRAEREFRLAISSNPAYASAHQWYSLFLSFAGRRAEALAEIQVARDLDPLSPIITVNHGRALADTGKFDEGRALLEDFLVHDPQFAVGHFELAHLDQRIGDYASVVRHLTTAIALSPGQPFLLSNLAWAHAKTGKPDEAKALLRELLARPSESYSSPGTIGLAQLACGEDVAAFHQFEKALEERDSTIIYLASREEWTEIIRDPRFDAIRARMSASAGRKVGM